MKQVVDRFIKRHQLLADDAIVVVGVSGGPDSMALLHYLYGIRRQRSLTLIAASADHGLRGEASAADVRYVERYCRERQIMFEAGHLDVEAYRKAHGTSVQAAARACRYRFFAEVMRKHGAHLLALGHHGDDQVETMVMQHVRGGLGRSRAGMPVRRPFAGGEIIRPLLAADKSEIEAYCREQGIEPRRDPTNDADDYTRNRFRHHVLPFMKGENPNVHVRFQQESERLFEDERYFAELAESRLDDVTLSRTDEQVTWSVEAFSRVPLALQRRLLHLVLNYLYQDIPPSLSTIHIEDIVCLTREKRASGQLDLPSGLRVIRSYDRLIFTWRKRNDEGESYRYVLHVPGEIQLPFGKITAEIGRNGWGPLDDDDGFVCDVDLVRLPLIVRTREPGDRLSPKGMKGSRKVKAIFIDEKIPVAMRDRWPLVTDDSGTMLWIPGVRRSGIAQPSRHTKRVMMLRFHQSGDVWEDV